MTDNLDDFFEQPSPEEETNTEIAPEAIEEQAEETSTEVTEPVTEPTSEPEQRQNHIPVAALQEEREKARIAREEAEQLRQRLAQIESAQQAQNRPDPFDDPAGYHSFMAQEMRREMKAEMALQNLNQSKERAIAKYGAAEIDQLADWAGARAQIDPNFESTIFMQHDPVEWLIEQRKRSDLLKSFEADPDAYVRQRALELGLAEAATQAPAQATSARKPTGPVSLNNAKSRDVAAVSSIQTAEEAFDAIFKK